MVMDHMVVRGLLPKACVPVWPVAPTGGATKGLRRIYKTTEKRQAKLRIILLELSASLRRDTALRASNWPASVGAALCWQKRDATETSPGASRYDYTTETSEVELTTLHRLEIAVSGFDR